MTTIIEEEVCCAICGQSTEIVGIGSTNESSATPISISVRPK